MRKYKKLTLGFTLVELLVAIAIIGVLVSVITISASSVRSKGRDAQVRSEKQQIILALVRARESNPNYLYPGTGTGTGWRCLKSSGNCWNNTYAGDATVITALSPYFSNGVVPQPPGTSVGQNRHDAYLYAPGPISVGSPVVTGSFVIWAQEKVITDCSGFYAGEIETGVYYCYEKLP